MSMTWDKNRAISEGWPKQVTCPACGGPAEQEYNAGPLKHSSLRSDPTPDGEKLSPAPALEVLDSGPADGLRFQVLIDGKHLFSAKTREIADAVGAHVIAASPFAAVEFAPNGCEWAGCKEVKMLGYKFCPAHKLARDGMKLADKLAQDRAARIARERRQAQQERDDFGGAFDGFTVSSDADPGL